MVRKKPLPAIVLCALLAAGPIGAAQKTIELGKDALWKDMQTREGVTSVAGRWGFQDLTLSSGQYAVDSSTELLLHFDSASEAMDGYSWGGAPPAIAAPLAAMGAGSAVFDGSRQGVRLLGSTDTMFSPGAVWGDFSIELWLYPASLSDGETILSWTGFAPGAAGGKPMAQSLRCMLRDRRLVWDFQNLFMLPGGQPIPVHLAGTNQLLPRVWHHHMLRFDSRRGMLEYRIDGVPEAIVHTTDTGSENGSIAVVQVGSASAGPLVLGSGYNGLMDELRISRRYVDDAVLSRFLGKTGAATSRIFDLGYSSTRVARIDAVASVPGDTSVEYYYQVADTWGGRKLLQGDTGWVPFVPGTDFKDTLKARYIQLRVELFPNGSHTQSPSLSDLTIVYEPNPPPAPPAGLVATAGNGTVTLTWRKVNDLDVQGYLVYYGSAPHNYLGTGAAQGDSPIDAGSATTLSIGGLDNGSLYYFAVTAYDTSTPRQQSEFGAEVSARPSRIYK